MNTNPAESREQKAETQKSLSKGPGPLWKQAWFQVPHQALVDFGIARERALDARRTARELKLPSVIETARWYAKEARRCWGLAMVGFSPSHSLPVSQSGKGRGGVNRFVPTRPSTIFRQALMRLELPPMTLAQAQCLRGLERGPMTAVRSAHRGWRAPDTAVGMLIGRVLAHYVPAATPGEAPSYQITHRGREVVARLLGDEETRALVDVTSMT